MESRDRYRDVPMLGVLIRRSVQDVFDYVMRIEETPRWRPRMSEVAWTTEGEPAVGSRFRVKVKALGITFQFTPEIIAWDPPHSVEYRQATGPVLTDSFLDWRAVGPDCYFSLGGKPRPNGRLMTLAEPLFYGPLFKQNYFDLLRLKAILEDREPDPG